MHLHSYIFTHTPLEPADSCTQNIKYVRHQKIMATAVVAVFAFTIILAVHLPAVASAEAQSEPIPAEKYINSKIYYNIKVENRMPAEAERMDIDCQAGFSFYLSAGESGTNTFSPAAFVSLYDQIAGTPVTEVPVPPRAYCTWAYAGNYMNKVPIFNVDWPEAERCTDSDEGSYCTAVFDGGQLFVEAPGMPQRLLGDLAIKRCKMHWFFGQVGSDCSLPQHKNPYAGYVLEGYLDYISALQKPDNL